MTLINKIYKSHHAQDHVTKTIFDDQKGSYFILFHHQSSMERTKFKRMIVSIRQIAICAN